MCAGTLAGSTATVYSTTVRYLYRPPAVTALVRANVLNGKLVNQRQHLRMPVHQGLRHECCFNPTME